MNLNAELEARLEPPATDDDAARLVGVEHEFVVRDGRGPVDFRTRIAGLDLGGRRLDPGDPLAVRGRWGGVITADGREAEVATPPVRVRPGFSDELASWTVLGAERLRRAAPDLELDGYSTHVSVEVDDGHVVRVARRFTSRFALAQMLLVDGVDSPGLLVRPRRGRLELCGEYVAGSQLRAASVFAVAATAAAQRRTKLPPKLRPVVEPARGRYGFYVDRRAFGPDLYRTGRGTLLSRGSTAQDVLARSWEAVRPEAVGTARADEVALVDDVVEGRRPLPLEGADGGRLDAGIPARDAPTGRVVEPRRRPGLVVEPVVATWAGTAFAVRWPTGAGAVVTIPLRLLDGFLVALDGGRLDDVLHRVVAAAPTLPRLMAAGQLEGVGAFGGMGAGADLVPSERDPLTGRLAGAGRGARGSRENKDRHDAPKGRSVPKWLVGAAAVLGVLVLLAALASALSGGDEGGEDLVAGPGPSTTTTTEAGAVAAPAVAATEIDFKVWRGWVAGESDDLLAERSRYYSRAWYADGSSTSEAVVWRQDSHHRFEVAPEFCQRIEAAGSATGAGLSQGGPTPSIGGYLDLDGVPGYTFNAFNLEGTIPLDGIALYCGGTEQRSNLGGVSTFLGGFTVGAPAAVDAVPETLGFRQTGSFSGSPTERRTYVVCMTRSILDTDGDGLPDAVDLDPGTAGSLLELGIPGGPPDQVIASQVPGGPDGVEGIPDCPTSTGAGGALPAPAPALPGVGVGGG